MAGLNANAMLWRTSPVGDRARGHHGRLASRGSRAAGLVRRPLHGHRVHEHAFGTRGRSRARHRRYRGTRPGGSARSPAAGPARLRLARSPLLDRQGRDDAWARSRRGPQDRRRRRLAMIPWRSGRRSPRTARPAGCPCAVVSTIGTTSSTAIDPVAAVADICEREGIWHHVDAAYAGAVALIPERRGPFRAGSGRIRSSSTRTSGCSRRSTARSCSRGGRSVLRAAFSLVPEYLRTTGGGRTGTRLQRVLAAARPTRPVDQDVGPAALLRPRRACVAASRRISTSRRWLRRRGRRRAGRGAARARPRSRRSASAGARRATRA